MHLKNKYEGWSGFKGRDSLDNFDRKNYTVLYS